MHYTRHTRHKLIILRTVCDYFLNSLIQNDNFFKIRQIYNIKKAIGGLLADFEEIIILYEGIKKMVDSLIVGNKINL